jgi:hypothetical protein
MKEESAKITTSLEYAHIGGLSVQLQGTHPKSINGLSPLALIKVVYPSGDAEEVMMDLVTKQYYVSHGYTLKLTDIDIGTSYLPWKKMFTGTVSLTALSDEQDRLNDDSGSVSSDSFSGGDPINLSSKSLEVSNDVIGKEKVTAVGSKIGEQSLAIQTLQTSCGACTNYNNGVGADNGISRGVAQRSDTTILAIVLGLISLGLLGLAFALVKRRD